MKPNAWNLGARWEVGPRGVVMFELGLRAFEDARRENDGDGRWEAIVERGENALRAGGRGRA